MSFNLPPPQAIQGHVTKYILDELWLAKVRQGNAM
jgi:hypothetical protein